MASMPRSGPGPELARSTRKTKAEKKPTVACGSQRAQCRSRSGSHGTHREILASSSGGSGRKAKASTNRSWRSRCSTPWAIRASECKESCFWVFSFTPTTVSNGGPPRRPHQWGSADVRLKYYKVGARNG